MLQFINKKIEKIRSKRSLHEYGFHIKTYSLTQEGEMEYAQWMHPYEQPKKYTQSNINFYKNLSKKESLVIDIGAHTGDTSVPMSMAIGKNGTVLALEPNPYVFKILKKNSELNKDKTNIIPLNFAATEVDGDFEFNYSDASFCNGGFFQKIQNTKHGHNCTLKVLGKNLENYLRENYSPILNTLSLIKVDAEGYDKEILKSLISILSEFKPNLISECNAHLNAEERNELFELLNNLGYLLYKLDEFDENFETTRISNSSEMMNWKHFDLIAFPKKP